MSQIPKHRKVKRATVIVKRTQCLKNHHKNKSYKPLCEKLKSNNSSLAKALSKEKRENQLLFSQNVALTAEIQDLGLACSKRDAVIGNVLKNAKQMLEMLVTMSGYLTNTISSCQEYASSSGISMPLSRNSTGRRDSYRRLSTKSPARGVVKPMVSGHTITKPTINLSRVNMQHFNNTSNLSIIPEAITPPRNEVISPRALVTVPIRQRRCENTRTCRLPERLTVSSPRISDESERRLSKKSSRHSGRKSGKILRPKSGRLSGNHSARYSAEIAEHMGSPRVKLNDVSKLLQNSQSINIRMLPEIQSQYVNESPENSDEMNQDEPRTDIKIPETPSADCSTEENDKTRKDMEVESDDESFNNRTAETNNELPSTSNWEDPLEGPSWLFSNPETVPCSPSKNAKTDNVNTSNDSTCSVNSQAAALNNSTDDTECAQQISQLPALNKRSNLSHNSKKDKPIDCKNTSNVSFYKTVGDDSLCENRITTPISSDSEEDDCKEEPAMNLANFVTQRRGYCESECEDDFTLLYVKQPRNMHFDINDLKLPVLEESTLKPLVVNEPEPEITATVRKISQICPIASAPNNSMDESVFNQTTVQLPLLINNDCDDDATPQEDKQSKNIQSRKKQRATTFKENATDYINSTPTTSNETKQRKRKKKATDKKDPSTAKVVLQKLNESDVKPRTPSPDIYSHNNSSYLNHYSSDSESSNASTNSTYTTNRPRRKRTPLSFQEPSLRKKLRRNQ